MADGLKSGLGQVAESLQVVKTVYSRGVAVSSGQLQGITADNFELYELKGLRAVFDRRSHHSTQGVRFTLTGRAGASTPQHGRRVIHLRTILEGQSQLVTNDGGIHQFQRHAGA